MSEEEIRFEYVYADQDWYDSDPIYEVKNRIIIETKTLLSANVEKYCRYHF